MYRIAEHAEDITADDKNHVHFVPKHNVTQHPKEEMVEIRLYGCRCPLCKEADLLYLREYRARKAA